MSALQRANELKSKRKEKKEKEKKAKDKTRGSEQKLKRDLEDVVDRVLREFDGVNGIEFSRKGSIYELRKDMVIFKASVGWHTYINPNVDYKDEITEIVINWNSQDPVTTLPWVGHDSNEADFTESTATVLSTYI